MLSPKLTSMAFKWHSHCITWPASGIFTVLETYQWVCSRYKMAFWLHSSILGWYALTNHFSDSEKHLKWWHFIFFKCSLAPLVIKCYYWYELKVSIEKMFKTVHENAESRLFKIKAFSPGTINIHRKTSMRFNFDIWAQVCTWLALCCMAMPHYTYYYHE